MNIVVPTDNVPFSVELQDVIRITGEGTPKSKLKSQRDQ